MQQLFEAKADAMNLGLDLNTERNLPWGQISAQSRALRFERGSKNGAGVMTGPGFQVSATPVADVGYDGSLESLMVRPTLWVALGTKIQYSHDAVTFYDTGLTRTATSTLNLTAQGFVEGPDGDVFTGNQTDSPVRIAVGILKADVALNGDIDVGTVYYSKFTASGTVYVNGTAVTYSGKDGTSKLTGTNIAATSAGALVIQTSNPGTWTVKGYILLSVESRMVLMGVKDHENIVYNSDVYTLANPDNFYDFGAGSAGSKSLPGKITAGITGMSGGFIFLARGIHRFTGFDTTTGALTSSEISNKYGAYNHRCVVDMDGQVSFMGQKRLMPISLTLSPYGGTAPFIGEDFDHPLRPWFDSHDDTNAQDRAYLKWDSSQKILKMGAAVGGALETYAHDKQAGAYLPTENRSVATSCMFLGRSFFGHTDNGKWYEDDLGRTNDGIPISHIISTGRIEYDKGRRFLNAKEFRYEGWITQATTHILRAYVNGAADASFEVEYASDDLITSQSGRPIGLRGIGISIPGGSPSDAVIVYPYVNRVLLVGLNGEDFRFEWEVTGDGQFFQVNTWYLGAWVQRKQPRTSV